eukprot:1638412-Prymnesium_polylepis.2
MMWDGRARTEEHAADPGRADCLAASAKSRNDLPASLRRRCSSPPASGADHLRTRPPERAAAAGAAASASCVGGCPAASAIAAAFG